MAYVALYRTWRPQTFEDLVGQAHIKTALSNALESGRISHAYLFTGPRGSGKTSTARILAKALNCEHGPTAHPCNECTLCREITEGTAPDVIEIDGASNRGIEEMKKLRDQVFFAPAACRYKVYINDEVHMITTDAFNALLKTLEEPPEHVVFILATTEPQKIPATILSRCQRYDFHRVTVPEIAEHLEKVAEGSHIQAEKEALRLIAIQADGGMRDALSLLDQCSVMASPITAEAVRQMIGSAGREKIRLLTEQIGKQDLAGALATLNALLEQGKELEQILAELMEYFRALLLYQVDPAYQDIYVTDEETELARLAPLFSRPQLMASEEKLHQAAAECKRSLRKKIVGELCLYDLCKHQGSSEAALEARIRSLEEQVAALTAGGFTAPAAAPLGGSALPAAPAFASPAAPAFTPKPASVPVTPAVPAWKPEPAAFPKAETKSTTAPVVPSAPVVPTAAPAAAAANVTPLSREGVAQGEELWQTVIQGLKQRRKRAFLVYAKMAQVGSFANQVLTLVVDSESLKERFETPDLHNLMTDILKERTGQPIGLAVVLQAGGLPPEPARWAAPQTPPQPAAPAATKAAPQAAPEPAPKAAAPAPAVKEQPAAKEKPAEPEELPPGVKKALSVFGGKVYKEEQ